MDLTAFDLKGKAALVTGGAHGIGFSIAEGMGPGYIATAPLPRSSPMAAAIPSIPSSAPRPPQAAGAPPRTWSAPACSLASHASDFVNGQILYADGGILAYIGKQPK